MKITGFGIANYRSFCGEGSFVHGFGKVNVFIGKNNSGKSNILRFLQFVSSARANYPNKPVESELDRNRKATEQILLGIAVDLEIRADPSYALVDPSKPMPKTIEAWMEFPGGQAAGKNPFEPFTERWLARFQNEMGLRPSTDPRSRKELLSGTLAVAARQWMSDFQRTMTKMIWV